MEVTLATYRRWVEVTIHVLKKKFTNLTAEDAHKMASDIVDAIVKEIQ